MIACKKCGFHNQDADSFCGSCGGFLEWVGEQVTPKISEEIVQEAEQAAEAPRKGLLSRMQSVIYADVGKAEPIDRSGSGPGGMPGRPAVVGRTGGGGIPGPPPGRGGIPGGGGIPGPPP
ncbi:hypothetical protein AB0D08_32265, partial [Kitasatospora sp. NPDC048540]